MAIWEAVRDAVSDLEREGRAWSTTGEIKAHVHRLSPDINGATIDLTVRYHCINDRSAQHSPNHAYRSNPLFVNDDPSMRGKRYRSLTAAERASYLSNPVDALWDVSYQQTLEWLANPSSAIDLEAEDETLDMDSTSDVAATGVALLELHLQDYIHRHWAACFPELTLYGGGRGREFRTSDPSVGIIDFLAEDASGNYVVIETKKDQADRRAVGQIAGYMGWVQTKLCDRGQTVRGILLASDGNDQLAMAAAAMPNLSIQRYEISFRIAPV